MNNNRQRIGRWGEDTAAGFLARKGYAILARNFRTPHGEIDIIAMKDKVLTFIEVKTRSNNTFGYPEQAVNTRKQVKMQAAAQVYLEQQKENITTWQFDVLAIIINDHGHPEIEHFENIIE